MRRRVRFQCLSRSLNPTWSPIFGKFTPGIFSYAQIRPITEIYGFTDFMPHPYGVFSGVAVRGLYRCFWAMGYNLRFFMGRSTLFLWISMLVYG